MISVFTDDAPTRMIGEPGPLRGFVYTDGSSLNPLDAQCKRAGWAVVTMHPDGTYSPNRNDYIT
eukprot:4450429-Amphidinium_carterae.1